MQTDWQWNFYYGVRNCFCLQWRLAVSKINITQSISKSVRQIGSELNCIILSETNRTNYEGILKRELFNGYDPDVKPTIHASDPIDVALSFYLYQIENLVNIIRKYLS